MPINFETAFGIHQHTLALRARRAEVLAANMVNADTPNYKARDYDFDAALKQAAATGAAKIKSTHSRHIQTTPAGLAPGELLYRTPLHASLDGNTVDSQKEQVEFSQNAAQYQASIRFLTGRVKGLLSAIRGD
ncbi:MAG TPA: flagellar basal body rod protein FlgB [Chromatiaceae bacterium]|jgi:flagellar basal-body rod protein FlgB|nr:flagellar basal body rod protein FlgB [Chromatiaceae bacterium]HIB84485.1 flagellar basal body rod protein FlgB [Chromatiaceae bacterium]HIN82707.1 flagellar basal body rod protein FlgB [Chromatiales bacterium]HIO14669.1 flagellar basal body rod protein FlgB [Chromatiales bacterium]HIO53767.1 flagellar basal body rod protein FlgB [Chromatiales bacterium]